MKRPTDWYDRLDIENGHIVRIVEAVYDKGPLYSNIDVYKESDDKKYWQQNMYTSMYGGNVVVFPGLPIGGYYYNDDVGEVEGWQGRQRPSLVGYSGYINRLDCDIVCRVYPDFKYVLKKVDWACWSRLYLMKVLQVYVKHPELELVMAAGYEKIAINGNFWRLSQKNRHEIALWMRKYPKSKFSLLDLNNLRECMKTKDPENYVQYLTDISYWDRTSKSESCIRYDDYIYLKNLKIRLKRNTWQTAFNQKVSYWQDYIRMAVRTNHNTQDPYWRHPKDLLAKHDIVMEELNRIVEAERIAAEIRNAEIRAKEESKRCKELEKLKPAMERILKKFASYNFEIDGYNIFVTTDYAEWKKQADTLHQCIVASGYYTGMLKGGDTIVFIQKEGVPIATAQIYADGKVGQFYADERDRQNCLPTAEVKAAFEKWLEMVPKSKFKKRKAAQKKAA